MNTGVPNKNYSQKQHWALAGVAQRTERGPANQSITSSIPVRAHAWVAGHAPSMECARGNHTLVFHSFSFSLPSPLSKNNK